MKSMILAVDRNGGIGYNGGLPWPRIDEDMAWFRHVTMQHKRCIMGRKTWESVGKLEGRDCHVVTSCTDLKHESGITVHATPPPLEDGDIVIGGASMCEYYATEVDVVFLTLVDGAHESDVKIDLERLLVLQKLRRYLHIEGGHTIRVYARGWASDKCASDAFGMLLDYERTIDAHDNDSGNEREYADQSEQPPSTNAVNHPSHYTQSSIEIIDAIGAITAGYDGEDAFCAGNVVKYIARAPFKGNKKEDLQKALWYLNRLINGGDDDY